MVRALHMENGRVRKEAGGTARGCPRADSNCHSGAPQGGRHITPPCGPGSKSTFGALVCERVIFTHSVRKVKKKKQLKSYPGQLDFAALASWRFGIRDSDSHDSSSAFRQALGPSFLAEALIELQLLPWISEAGFFERGVEGERDSQRA